MSPISPSEARAILDLDWPTLIGLLPRSGAARQQRDGEVIDLCSIVNARSGACDQDCAFCSQSRRSQAEIRRYGLISTDELVLAARQARENGASRFSIVTSGHAVTGADLDRVVSAVERIKSEVDLSVCASLGCLDAPAFSRLKAAGLARYHHNMETGESFWPLICTTRPYDEQRRTVRLARAAGLEVCSGGIFGLGESLDQRIELLLEVRELEVEAVALNFFNPIPGTPLAHLDILTPLDGLKIIVAARLLMPDRDIRICGGRERNLRDLQSLIFAAGASGLMIGGYLTTPGRAPAADLALLEDLGLHPRSSS